MTCQTAQSASFDLIPSAPDRDGAGSEMEAIQEVTVPVPESSPRSLRRRVAQPIAAVLAAAVVGYAGFEVHNQSLTRPAAAPETAFVNGMDFVELGHTTPAHTAFVPSFVIQNTGKNCGPWSCKVGDLCCPNRKGGGGGWVCGNRDAVCCQGHSGSITCAKGGKCCKNVHNNAYCCAGGNSCSKNVCVAGPGQCFPGEAVVELIDGTRKRLDDLQVGGQVLVEVSAEGRLFEPVLGFLHEQGGVHESLSVKHSRGEFRVSANHLVFTQKGNGRTTVKLASDLEVGDKLLNDEAELVEVVAVKKGTTSSGMYAPLTASGKIIVDGITASTYASHSSSSKIPHGSFHSAFFLARVSQLLGFSTPSTECTGLQFSVHALRSSVQGFVKGMFTSARA